MACHTELAPEIAQKTGFHGRLTAESRNSCESCHPDHRGRDFQMIDWQGDRRRFDHQQAGWALLGKHARTACETCHDNAKVTVPAIAHLLASNPRRTTYLGLSTRCASCHFDEHRGQLGHDCQKCHNEAVWRPVPTFNHDKTAFPLHGKHKGVPCDKCHPTTEDDHAPTPGAYPAPRARFFLQMKPVDHATCASCHEDPHQGKLGPRCADCHTDAGWKIVRPVGGLERSFHERTAFPLIGAHIAVPCRSCHGPFPGVRGRFKGLPFAKCTDCHDDAHEGQLALATAKSSRHTPGAPSGNGRDCAGCHDTNGFSPTHFEVERHAETRFPLDGAHQASPCRSCHPIDRRLEARVPPAVKAKLRQESRPLLISLAVLKPRRLPDECAACHEDVHRGQFTSAAKPQECASCHKTTSFSDLHFDHSVDSRFALTGAHAKAPCVSCHKTESIREGEPPAVRYKPLPTRCDGCHADEHQGQLVHASRSSTVPASPTSAAMASTEDDCSYCHSTTSFTQTAFRHDDVRFTTFALRGKHAALSCAACHRKVIAAPGISTVRYRPLPSRCDACHADFHKGEFRDFATSLLAAGVTTTDCDGCHLESRWSEVRFDHNRTLFPLKGAHVRASCRACHRTGFEAALPNACAGCHRDRHAGTLGLHCEGCHGETDWRAVLFWAGGHSNTRFPLVGKHGAIPCQDCHGNLRDRTFSPVAVACVSCHRMDYDSAKMRSIDHNAAGFSPECQGCHDTWSFFPARFEAHDVCFRLSAGSHRSIRCLQCHTSITGLALTGACSTQTTTCITCHAHTCARSAQQHKTVMGYSCADQRCYQCHQPVR